MQGEYGEGIEEEHGEREYHDRGGKHKEGGEDHEDGECGDVGRETWEGGREGNMGMRNMRI